MNFISKLFDYNQKQISRLESIVDAINAQEPQIKKLSDQELKDKTDQFKKKIADGIEPRELIPEAFAVVREAGVRTLGLRQYDVQLMASIALWEGKIAEQKTGEGKTLSAVAPLYLRALEGKGAHLVTVNDYLARIGCGWMGPIFSLLDISVGCIIPDQSYLYDPEYQTEADDWRLENLKPVDRKESYQADVTYGTNNEFGFDYLRDNMSRSLDDYVQREHFFAIVDEIDFALIDEARTPLIISSPEEKPTEKYYQYAQLAEELFPETDYIIDEKARTAMLTEYGIRKIERKLGVGNLYEEDFETIHQIENALKARTMFNKDEDYVVKDDQVVIVDEFTGRLMEGRRWSDGLHQAVEAKEGVTIQKESKTWATITFQNYFRKYEVLSGMTGTAETEKEEFKNIYDLDVIVLPTNKPVIREDHPDEIYKTRRAKFTAVAAEIERCYQKGQPVLVGTTSIDKNEMVSNYLKKKNIPHQILNAKHHLKEAKIISQAGQPKAVTIATNMAGRGVDIVLGGEAPKKNQFSNKEKFENRFQQWQQNRDKVLDLGGLYVIGTERHEARRIDNQLRGRSGRQGDPGASKFYVSLQDDLMRVFGGEKIENMMNRLKMPENQPISHSMVTKMIKQIQVKVEGFNYDIRKSLVEFDDIVNKQREIIYTRRKRILDNYRNEPEKIKNRVLEMVNNEFQAIWNISLDPETMMPDYQKLVIGFTEIIPLEEDGRKKLKKDIKSKSESKTIKYLKNLFQRYYQQREEMLGSQASREIEKSVLLYTIDNLWVDHLTALDNLKESVRLRGYGQRDPLVEYRKESFQMFQDLLAKINRQVARRIMRVEVGIRPSTVQRVSEGRGKMISPGQSGGQDQLENPHPEAKKVEPIVSDQPSPGRNDPCPCGSGEKYKKCCYPKYD